MNKLIPLLLLLPLLGCAHHRGDGASVDLNHGQAKKLPIVAGPEHYGCGSPVLNNILFEFDRATMNEDGKATANTAIQGLETWNKDTVLIEGHTCDVGTSDYNLALGAKRAQAVADYMTLRGADPSRIAITTYGEEMPAVPNNTEKNRALNRRAVIKFTPGHYPSEPLN